MSLLIKKLPAIAYGGDYNPEQWPESLWNEDMRLMREAGVNLVSVGIFSWAKLQPVPNRYDFGWLDRLMDLLAANGIYADLATATASPPPWMTRLYPDVQAIDRDLRPWWHGGRQHYSPWSPSYRRFAALLTRRLARRYKNHPALVAWHINNEYACHVQECHSPAAVAAFGTWLKRKYGTLSALNAAWGTSFWSQQYHDWRDVLTPRRSPAYTNPAQELDYRRFFDDGVRDLYLAEKQILNRITPGVPVTTNFMAPSFKALNYRRWAEHLDFASWDAYPDPATGPIESAASAAFGHDLMRSLKPDRPFILMEQAPSQVNWRAVNAPKAPGTMRATSLQAVARGADGVMFFQWRASLGGAEKYHSGMVSHCGAEKSRVFAEITQLGADLRKLAPVAGTTVTARVGILFDWESWWALEQPAKPAAIDVFAIASDFHRWFWERNIAVDFVSPASNLNGYSVIVAPALYVLSKKDAENLREWTRQGGSLLATYFSGIVDECEHVVPGGYPGYLRDVLGIWIEEWGPLSSGERTDIKLGRRSFPATDWTESIHLTGARELARFGGGIFKGKSALTEHSFGKGVAYYIGTRPLGTLRDWTLNRIIKRAKVESGILAGAGVEACVRRNDESIFYFFINHSESPRRVDLGNLSGENLLTGGACHRVLHLEPFGFAVLARENTKNFQK